jgi:adenylate cyclase
VTPHATPREIERKFLVVGEAWRKKARAASHIVQGYLARGRKATVRVRIKDDKVATLTIKSREPGASRSEFEYRIPLKHARALLDLCGSARIDKRRFEVAHGRLKWEIDVFGPPHEGLVVAEVEMPSEGTALKLPDWIGEEVTDNPAYRNSALVDAS